MGEHGPIRGSEEHLAGRSRIQEPITGSNRLVQGFHLEWEKEGGHTRIRRYSSVFGGVVADISDGAGTLC
jgi:hypothetical protein